VLGRVVRFHPLPFLSMAILGALKILID